MDCFSIMIFRRFNGEEKLCVNETLTMLPSLSFMVFVVLYIVVVVV